MDFSCDRCGRRYFVPDDLVHGRVFRAKCDDCCHAFDVVAPEDGAAAAFSPPPARAVKLTISDDDVARIVAAARPFAAGGAVAAGAPVARAGPAARGGPVEEPLLPNPHSGSAGSSGTPLPKLSRASAGSSGAPLPKLSRASAGSSEAPLPKLSRVSAASSEPPLPKLSLVSAGPSETPLPKLSLVSAASSEPPLPRLSFAPDGSLQPPLPPLPKLSFTPFGALEIPRNDPVDLSDLVEPEPEPEAPPGEPIEMAELLQPEELVGAEPEPEAGSPEAEPEEIPRAAPRQGGRRAAIRTRPARAAEPGGKTEEFVIAAGARNRHGKAAIALAGAAVVAAGAVFLVARFAGRSTEPARRRQAAEETSTSGSVPFDASSLAARQRQGAQAPSAKPGGSGARSRRRIVVGRVDDRKLLDLMGKKDDVQMATPGEDVELDSAKDVIDPAAVERTVASSRRSFDACISKVMRLNPGFRVPGKRATIMVTVQPTGRVTGAWIGEEQVEGTDLGRCLVAAATRMAFPRFQGEPIDVSIPLSLSAIQ